MQGAAILARICKEGDAYGLYTAHQFLNESGLDAWRLAMQRVAKFDRVSPAIQNAFVSIWIESKMLPLRVGNRPVLAKAGAHARCIRHFAADTVPWHKLL